MAVVMAVGIIIHGILINATNHYVKVLCILNVALWISFSILLTSFNHKFKDIHITNPINRFGIGTWVAGTSICGILIYQQFVEWVFLAEIITYLNIGLWLFYMGICIKTFYELTSSRLVKNVHGILLLTTVSTQSIVLLINTIYKDVPLALNISLITLGFSLYIICLLHHKPVLFGYLVD
jgi:hypothetical protein